MTIAEALQLALGHHNAGRLQDAEQAYRQILAQIPNEANSLYLLGHLKAQTRRWSESAELLQRAVAIAPGQAQSHAVLGEVFESLNRPDDAIASYRAAISIEPERLEVRTRLGHVLLRLGRFEAALDEYEHVLSRRPDDAFMQANVAEALRQMGRMVDAERHARRAVSIDPTFAGGFCKLGSILHSAGRYADAVREHEAALKLAPNLPDVWSNLGLSLAALKQGEAAVRAIEHALKICPRNQSAPLHVNLGTVLVSSGRVDEAVAEFQTAIEIDPTYAEAFGNLGIALREQGRIDEAIDCYRRAIALAPEVMPSHSRLLFALNADGRLSADQILQEHRDWADKYVDPLLANAKPHRNTRETDRRIRVCYVSPDFRDHPVGRFLLPLFERHDRDAFEIVCYLNSTERDSLTQRFQSAAHVWRDVAMLPDEQLVNQIREDGIDILVDLTLHASGNRLMTFARKPAPVQMTFLSYAGTSGMRAMDYRISDPHLDPPGGDADRGGRAYSETTLRLARSYWCYEPHPAAPVDVGPTPLHANGHVTFGSLNQFGKVNDAVLATWATILAAVPGSRLLLHSFPGSHRDRVASLFASAGVDSTRIEFVGKQSVADYFAAYDRIDVGLDPFPYAGGTTTCDALWMGIPVVTLAGQTAVGRAGVSVLTNAGLPELIGRDLDEYVALAIQLAGDVSRLSELRASMRTRLVNSPIMDAAGYAREIETVFRTAWRNWRLGGNPG